MASTRASWAMAVRDTLRALSLDADALLQGAGIDPATLASPDARIPVQRTARLWSLAVQASGDPAFGLQVARRATPETFHALGVSLFASRSLHEALQRLVRYFAVVTEIAALELQHDPTRTRLLVRAWTPATRPAPEAVDALASLVVRLARALTGREFAPVAVHLRRPEPPDATPWRAAFRAPIQFGAEQDAVAFDPTASTRDLPQSNARLARSYDRLAARELAGLAHDDSAAQVRLTLYRMLANGEPSAAQVARALNLSLRTLQRRLAGEGTCFAEVLDRTRHELALAHLADTRCSVGEIAYLLGFTHAASFTHACRRWSGMPPGELRASLVPR